MASRLSAMRLTAAVVAFLAVAVTTNDHDDFSGIELVLLHISDMHSRFEETDVKSNECRIEDAMQDLCYGGFARVAQFVHDERQKAENSNTPLLFLMAGDEFHGTAYFTIFHWKPVAEIISRLRPDVMVATQYYYYYLLDIIITYYYNVYMCNPLLKLQFFFTLKFKKTKHPSP